MEEVKDDVEVLDAEAQKTFDDIQKQKDELGIPREPEEKSPVEEPVDDTDPKDEPKQVSVKEEPVDPKEYKDYKTKLREELQSDFDQKLEKLKEEMSKTAPNETKTDDLEEEVAKLAKDLDFDPDKIKKIIEVARKGMELSAEDKLTLQNIKEQKEVQEQEKIFNEEWQTLPLKEQFPNASKEQLDKAKETMDELAHSEKYHDMDMDYILFKEKDKFSEILFSPKQKTFESGKLVPTSEENDEFPEFNPNMTPAQFEAFEKKRNKASENMGKEKVLVRTTDDSGRSVERFVSQG